jgi:hypothetical protein
MATSSTAVTFRFPASKSLFDILQKMSITAKDFASFVVWNLEDIQSKTAQLSFSAYRATLPTNE